jgi:RHS repeat-associated protein
VIDKVVPGGSVTATITRTYDGHDRLTQEVTAEGTVNYVYDNASRRTSMTVAGQTAVTFTYDNANRLTQVQQGTSTVTLGYDNADRRTSLTLPNTNSITYAYNAASELTSLTYKKGATTLGTLLYTYDAAGNRIKTGGTFARSNLPPALTTVSYNANNQQTTFGTNTETYDLNGNLATVTDAGVTTTYTWNARNQLTGISNTGFSASFTYDSFGRRTGKTIQGTTTNFVYDGLNPVQEKAGATVTANLLTGLGIDEFFTRTDGVGSRALLPEALGSTVALGDGTGTLQTQYTYEPFGYTTQTGQANTNSYKYTGREDDGTGLYFYRARYYHPRLQRFISEDPIRFRGGDVNLYGYVRNNPIRLIDPFGLRPLTLREKKCLRPYIPQVDLDNADLHDGEVPWYLWAEYDGITRGNDIYLRPGAYDKGGIGILGHELYHVGQYRQGLTWVDFLIAGLNGHDNSPLEIPAMALEREIRVDMQGPNGVNCPCGK